MFTFHFVLPYAVLYRCLSAVSVHRQEGTQENRSADFEIDRGAVTKIMGRLTCVPV